MLPRPGQAADDHGQHIDQQGICKQLTPLLEELEKESGGRFLLAKANIPADRIDRFYRPPTRALVDEKGQPMICQTCRGNGGYVGRTAAFELLEISDEVRELIASGESLQEIKRACRKNGMKYLQDQSLEKVITGETSIQEVIRVTQARKK